MGRLPGGVRGLSDITCSFYVTAKNKGGAPAARPLQFRPAFFDLCIKNGNNSRIPEENENSSLLQKQKYDKKMSPWCGRRRVS
jgi:hypothetical protein